MIKNVKVEFIFEVKDFWVKEVKILWRIKFLKKFFSRDLEVWFFVYFVYYNFWGVVWLGLLFIKL